MLSNPLFSTNVIHVDSSHLDPAALEAEIRRMEDLIRLRGGCLGEMGQTPPPVYHAFLRSVLEQEEIISRKSEFTIDLEQQIRARMDLPHHAQLDDQRLHETLHSLIHWLCRFHIRLDFTNELTDRVLYQRILDEVLPEELLFGCDPRGTLLHQDMNIYDEADFDDLEYDDLEDAFSRRIMQMVIACKNKPQPHGFDRDEWIRNLAETYRMESLPDLV